MITYSHLEAKKAFDIGYKEGKSYILSPDKTQLTIMGTRLSPDHPKASIEDIATDLTIPLGQLNKTRRYQQIRKVMYNNRHTLQTVRGHSLGSSILSDINQKNAWSQKIPHITLYNAPILQTTPQPQNTRDYSNQADLISLLDQEAQKSKPIYGLKAHYSYDDESTREPDRSYSSSSHH